jgi:hypothetical protein
MGGDGETSVLKILGAGLPRTGTATLAEALRVLGFKTMHHGPGHVPLFPSSNQLWPQYDGVDAVTDAPASMYWRELRRAYNCKIILTVRESFSWWESIKWHANQIRTGSDIEHIRYTEALHSILFGWPQPCEYWYTRRFAEHNAFVKGTVPADELLVMDIHRGDKWDVLCPFLDVPEPDVEFPWKNKSEK